MRRPSYRLFQKDVSNKQKSIGHLMASRPNFENQKLVTDQLLPLGTTSRYAQSKLCNILHALSLQHYFQPLNPASPTPNIKVFSVHPGPVATGLYAGPTASWPFIRRFIEFAAPYFLLTPKEGANTVLFAAAGKEVDERRIARWVSAIQARATTE